MNYSFYSIPIKKIKLFLILLTLILVSNNVFATATITIVNADGAGEGFNDTTAFTAVAGNTASTLGQARLNAIQHAANLLGSIITSAVEIKVSAQFNSLGGDAGSATLASAGTAFANRDFTGAIVTNTWYPAALADKLNGSDLNGGNDINMTVNSDLDGDTVLGTIHWYYGFDSTPSNSDVDFITVAMHELLHGLGFSSLVNVSTGAKFGDFNDTYMRNLEHHLAGVSDYPSMTDAQRVTASISDTLLHWTGPSVIANSGTVTGGITATHVHMYAPNPVQSGSSVSHFNTTVTPNEMMEPAYTGADHNIGLAAYLLNDIGWGTTNVNSNSVDLSITQTDSGTNLTPGSNETYNLVIVNNSGNSATEVVTTSMIPTGATYVSAVPNNGKTCFESNNTVTCHLGDITNGAPVGVAIIYTLNTAGVNTHTVFVDSINPDSPIANNSSSEISTVNVNPVDVGVSQTNTATIDYASNQTYAVTVTNTSGTDVAYTLVLTSTLPTNATYVSFSAPTGWSCNEASNVVTCNLNSLAASASSIVNIVARLNTVGTNTNTVAISVANTDANTANDSSSVNTTVQLNNIDMAVSQSSASSITIANNITYATTVTNTSATSSAATLVLTSTLPTGSSYVSYNADTGWTCSESGNVVTCNKINLAANTASTVNIVAKLNVLGSNSASASISALNTDLNAANDSTTSTTTVNPAPPPAPGGGSCFIATAAYGNNMESDVRYLRAFRDEYLLTNAPGRWFVKTYYRYSPAIANVIRDNKTLKRAVRVLLSPFVSMSRHTVSDNYLELQQ